jgi:hypothetical protein
MELLMPDVACQEIKQMAGQLFLKLINTLKNNKKITFPGVFIRGPLR